MENTHQFTPEELNLLREKALAMEPIQGFQPVSTVNTESARHYKARRDQINIHTPAVQHVGDVFEEVGRSRYDEGMPFEALHTPEGLRDWRASQQSTGRKWAGTPIKFATMAGTTILDNTVGFVFGGLSALTGGSFVDNEFSQWMQDIQQSVDEWVPLYTSTEYEESPWWQKMGTANWWVESVANQGFTAGVVASSALWGGLFTMGAKGLASYKIAKGLTGAAKAKKLQEFSKYLKAGMSPENATREIIKAGKFLKNTELPIQVLSSLQGSMSYARTEALGHARGLEDELLGKEMQDIEINGEKYFNQIRNEIRSENPNLTEEELSVLAEQDFEQFKEARIDNISDIIKSHTNATFATDLMYLTITNQLMFGKLFSGNFGAAKSAYSKLIRPKAGLDAVRKDPKLLAKGVEAVPQSKGKDALGYLIKNPMVQFFEESFLHINREYSGEFHKALYDEGANASLDGFREGYMEKMLSVFGDLKEWESGMRGFTGALLGAAGPVNRGGRVQGVTMSGGVWDAARALMQDKTELTDLIVKKTNDVLNKPEIQTLHKGIVKSMFFAEQGDVALSNDDKFDYENSQEGELINHVLMMEEVGLLDEFLDFIDSGKNVSAEQVREFYEITRDLDGSVLETKIDPFEGKSDEQVQAIIRKNAADVKEFANKIVEINEAMSALASQRGLSDVMVREMVYVTASLEGMQKRLLESERVLPTEMKALGEEVLKTARNKDSETYADETLRLVQIIETVAKAAARGNPAQAKEYIKEFNNYVKLLTRMENFARVYEKLGTDKGIIELLDVLQVADKKAADKNEQTIKDIEAETDKEEASFTTRQIKEEEALLKKHGWKQDDIDLLSNEKRKEEVSKIINTEPATIISEEEDSTDTTSRIVSVDELTQEAWDKEIADIEAKRTEEKEAKEAKRSKKAKEKPPTKHYEKVLERIDAKYDKLIDEINAKYGAGKTTQTDASQFGKTPLDEEDTILPTDERFEDGKNPDVTDEDLNTKNTDVLEELPEAPFNFKRTVASAIINRVRKHLQDATGKNQPVGTEINKEALVLSEWGALEVGNEVRVTVDTEYDGPVNQYFDDGRQVLAKGEAVEGRATYQTLRQDPDNLPIKIEAKRGDTWVKVGHLPTTSWVGEKNSDGTYANIANEFETMQGNAEAQIIEIKRLREQISNVEHGTPLTFTVKSKTNGTLLLDYKSRGTVKSKTPRFLEAEYWKEANTAPFTIFNKGFMVNKALYFDSNNLSVDDRKVDGMFPSGSLVMMIPSAIEGQYIPRAVNLNKIDTGLAQGIVAVVRAYMNNDKEAFNKMFEKTGEKADGLRNLKDFLEKFMYFTPVEDAQADTKATPKISYDFENAQLVLVSNNVARKIDLNKFRDKANPQAVEAQLEELTTALQDLKITARLSLLNKEESFFTPRVTEEGNLDFNTTTYNEHLSEYATTDLVENSYDENSQPVYSIQPVVEIEWNKADKTHPKPKAQKETIPTEEGTVEVFDWSDINTDAAKEILGNVDTNDIIEAEDSAIGVSEELSFYNLNEGRHLYHYYDLLNNRGGIKQVPDDKNTETWVNTLNKSPYYQFKLRKTSDGKNRILIIKDPLKTAEDRAIGINKVKPGVSELFKVNPELASIGTAGQYSNYLDTIFPDSKVKDIVYHGTDHKFDIFDETKYGLNEHGWFGRGIYFAKTSEDAQIYGKNIIHAILNLKQPQYRTLKEMDISGRELNTFRPSPYEISNAIQNKIDSVKSDGVISNQEDITVFEPSQIHILGSKQDIQGFKEFVGKQEDATIGVEQSQKINEDAYNYMVTDGDFKYSAKNQQEITDMVTSSVFLKLLEAEEAGKKIAVREAFGHAKTTIQGFKKVLDTIASRITTDEALKANKEHPSFPEEFKFLRDVAHIKFLQEEFNRLLKENVFKQFQLQVQDKLRTLNIVANEAVITDEVTGLETTMERTWDDASHLKMFGRDTATQKVKLSLSRIRSAKPNYLGIKGHIPFDTVFDDVTSIISSKPISNTLEQNINVLKSVALGNPYKSYLSQVAELLENPSTSQSLKNGFQSVMMRNNNDYVITIWNKGENGWNYMPVDANRNNVVSRIVETWNEFFGNSLVITEDKGVKIVDKEKLKGLGLTVKDIGTLKSVEDRKNFTIKLFNAIGIQLPTEGLDALFNSSNLKRDFNVPFPGTFQGQFTFTKKGEPNGLISNIVHALNTEEKIADDDVAFEVNNPFTGKNSERAIKALAKIMANYSEIIYSDSHRNINGDLVNNYSFHTPETLRIKALGDETVRTRLMGQPLTKNAFFLRKLNEGEKITFSLEDGLRQDGKSKGIGRPKMSDREQRLLALGLFQRSNPKYVAPTHSDKPGTPLITAPKVTFKINTDATITGEDKITRITKEALPPQFRDPQAKGNEIVELILAESRRIQHVLQLEETNTPAELKRELGEQYYEGSKYFYFFPELNNLVRNEKGNINFEKLKDINTLLDSALDSIVNTINNTIEEWYSNETIYYNKDKKKWVTKFNESYLNGLDSKSLPHRIVEAAADVDINYMVFNANMMMLVMDDPAKMFKKAKGKNATPIDHIGTSLDDYQKRAAKDMAPGALGYWKWRVGNHQGSNAYGVAYVNDVEYGTLMEGYLSTIEGYIGKIPRTDAQEWTTLEEHIDVMFAYGKLPDNIYTSIKDKIIKNRGKVYELTSEEMGYVLQPMKPVQIVRKWNPDFNIEETHYIKSSSFPLIPTLTLNSDLDKIRVAMETSKANGGRGVQRIAFKSATKVGVKRVNTLFSKEGIINETIDFTDENTVILDREGFFIQQEIPYEADKYKTVSASQINKLWLQGLDKNLEFKLGDKPYKTGELRKIKENVRAELFKMSATEIHKRLGVSLVEGGPIFTDLGKVRDALAEEAKQRGWGINDLDGLKLVDGKIAIPLSLNNSANRIESLLLSVFNGIVKQKISGFSAVQGSSEGLRNTSRAFDATKDKIGGKDGIVLIPNDKGIPLFDSSKGLQYTDLVGKKEDVKIAQVFISWKFKAKLKDVTDKNGMLDLSKVDPELLEIIGFRIPTQGHSSMIMAQVVGFLPENMGDLMLVPGEITKQMGSDFDVDKMYNYIFNNIVADSGVLVKIPGMELITVNPDFSISPNYAAIREWKSNTFKDRWKNKNELAKKVAEYLSTEENEVTIDEIQEKWTNERIDFQDLDMDSLEARLMDELEISPESINVPSMRELSRMILENAYIEILRSALSHKEVIKQSLKPLDRDDLKETGSKFKGTEQRPLFISRTRQLSDYVRQRAGKDGVGVFSRAVTGLAVVENYDIKLKVSFDGFEGRTLTHLSGMGKSMFGGEERTKSDNIVTQQSGAVDNARDPVLDSNHLNMQTFNASIILSMLEGDGEALNLEWNSYFLRQEIVKDYVREMEKLTDTVNEDYGTGTRKEQVIEKLQTEYLKRIGLEEYTRKKASFKLTDLTGMLVADDTSTVDYVESQLEVLERFVELDNIGQEYSTFLTAISTDSKGFGKDFFELSKRIEQLENVKKFELIEGLEQILEDSEQGTIAGYVNEVGNLMSQLFPYRQQNVMSAIGMLESLSGKDAYIDVEFRENIWKGLKSFIFTNSALDTTGNRQELFYGENSVAKRVLEAQQSWGSENLFLRKLNPIFAKKKGMPDMVTFTASLIERTDEINVIRHFTDMFTSDIQEVRDLAEALVQSAYMSGGIQEALQYVKYIPTAYLSNTNFSAIAEGSLGTFSPDRFMEQFIQHNPQHAYRYDRKFSVNNEGKHTVDLKRDPVLKDKTYISKSEGKGRWSLYKKVESNGDKHVYQQMPILGGRGKNYTAYNEYNYGEVGVQSSTIPENNPRHLNIVEKARTNPSPDTAGDNVKIKNESAAENRAVKYDTNKKGIEGFTDIVSRLETTRYKLLGEIFSEASDLLQGFEFSINNNLVSKEGVPNRGDHKGGKVSINPKAIKQYYELEGREVTNEDTEGVIMHEFTHAVTTALHFAHSEGQSHPLLTPQVVKRIENINTFFNVATSKLSDAERKLVDSIKKGDKDALGATTAEQQRVINQYYGFTSPREFIAESMSNPAFQRKMNGVEFKHNKTLLQRFADLVSELFIEIGKTLGLTVNEQSILAHTIREVVGLIEDAGNQTSHMEKITTKPVSSADAFKDAIKGFDPTDLAMSIKSTNLQTSVAGFMKDLNTVERDALRSLIKRKEIKFKCE